MALDEGTRRTVGVSMLVIGSIAVAAGLIGALSAGDGGDETTTPPTTSTAPSETSEAPGTTEAADPTTAPPPTTTAPGTTTAPLSTTAAPAATTVPETSSALPTTVPTTPPTAIGPAEVETFVVEVVRDSLRSGDVDELFRRFHPAVIEVYGAEVCAAYLPTVIDPDVDIQVVDVGPIEPWDWTTEGLTVPIDDAIAVDVDFTALGTTQRIEIHVAIVDGELRWFADCGAPGETSP